MSKQGSQQGSQTQNTKPNVRPLSKRWTTPPTRTMKGEDEESEDDQAAGAHEDLPALSALFARMDTAAGKLGSSGSGIISKATASGKGRGNGHRPAPVNAGVGRSFGQVSHTLDLAPSLSQLMWIKNLSTELVENFSFASGPLLDPLLMSWISFDVGYYFLKTFSPDYALSSSLVSTYLSNLYMGVDFMVCENSSPYFSN